MSFAGKLQSLKESFRSFAMTGIITMGEKGRKPFCGEMDASALEGESLDDAQVLPNGLGDGLKEA